MSLKINDLLSRAGSFMVAPVITDYLLDNIDSLDLKKRSEIHWARKIWHMSTVFFMFLAYVFLSPLASSLVLAVAAGLFIPVDFLRHRYPSLNDWLVHAFKPIIRRNEVHKIAGTTYLLTGVAVIDALFPRPVVSLTLLFLAFADPLASVVGIKYGKDKIFGHKSIQGFVAAFVVCALCTVLFLAHNNVVFDRVILVSLLAGLVGALAELLPIGGLDDNFTLPVFSAVGLYVLFSLFGLFTA